MFNGNDDVDKIEAHEQEMTQEYPEVLMPDNLTDNESEIEEIYKKCDPFSLINQIVENFKVFSLYLFQSMDCLSCHEEPGEGHDLCVMCQYKLCPILLLKKLPLEKRILEKFSPSSSPENKENTAKHINRKRKMFYLLRFGEFSNKLSETSGVK